MVKADLIQHDSFGLGHALRECKHGGPAAGRRFGLIMGNNNTNHGGIVCGGLVSNADGHPRGHGVTFTPYPITGSGPGTATRGPSYPARFGSGSHGVRYAGPRAYRSTLITSSPAPWAVRITRPTSGRCVPRATTATERPVVQGVWGHKLGGFRPLYPTPNHARGRGGYLDLVGRTGSVGT